MKEESIQFIRMVTDNIKQKIKNGLAYFNYQGQTRNISAYFGMQAII